MLIKHVSKLIFFIFLINSSSLHATEKSTLVRAAIDIGSGGTKLRVAEVDPLTNKITKILLIKQYPVLYQRDLKNSDDNRFSSDIMFKGIAAINDAVTTARSLGADKVVAVATGAFRSAINGKVFVEAITSITGVSVHLLDQDLEGKLAFNAALNQMDCSELDLLTWDIGGNSTQFIKLTEDGSHFVDCSNEGAGAYEKYIIESIQNKNSREIKSPNPLSFEDIEKTLVYTRGLSKMVDQTYKTKIKDPTTKVVGVGSVFGRGIAPHMNGKNPFTIDELRLALMVLTGKTDEELGGGDFISGEVSNLIFVLGFMEELDIKQMHIVDVNNADGAIVYPHFWQ